jgi:uncharacterized XkdX family phage protein
MAEVIKRWYNDERFAMWYQNKDLVKKTVAKGIITAEDYKEITGEEYTA